MLAVAVAAAGAGAAMAALLLFAARARAYTAPLEGWPLGGRATVGLAALALAAGGALRFVALGRLPEWLWIDDLSLIQPACLQGPPRDSATRCGRFLRGRQALRTRRALPRGYRLALLSGDDRL
jgi:hypothetical protein